MLNSTPTPLYSTEYGTAYVGDSYDLLKKLDTESVDLVLTSPSTLLLLYRGKRVRGGHFYVTTTPVGHF